jgi:hypothetical protein
MLKRKDAYYQAWFEAMLIVQGQLAQGTHPTILERRIKEELSRQTRPTYYRYVVVLCHRFIANLEFADSFAGLPCIAEYEEICPVQIERLEFEIMMYLRYSDFHKVIEVANDVNSAKEFSKYTL